MLDRADDADCGGKRARHASRKLDGAVFLCKRGRPAEAYLVRPRGAGPFPLIAFLHGHSLSGLGAIRLLPAAKLFAREVCYAGLAISLPGYGGTEVRAGLLEETTRSAVLDAIAAAKKLSWIDAERLYIITDFRAARWWRRRWSIRSMA